MAFCSNCGAELPDGAGFCSKCGTKMGNVQQASSVQQASPGPQAGTATYGTIPPVPEKKSFFDSTAFKVGGAAVIVIALIAFLSSVIGGIGKKVNVEDFVSYETEGFDGYGRLGYDIDEDAMSKSMRENNKKLSDEEISNFVYDLSLDFSEEENLSNGQEITVNLSYDKEYAKEHKIKVASDEWKYEIPEDCFEPIKECDPFAEGVLDITYTGTAPFASVSINVNPVNSDLGKLSYSSSITSGMEIKSGDVITVTCDSDQESLLRKGYVLTETEHTYTVDTSDMDSYIVDPSDLDEESMNRLKKDAEDIINAKLAQYNENFNFVNSGAPNFLGTAVIVGKDRPENEVYLIYTVESSGTNDPNVDYSIEFGPVTMYIPIEFSEVIRYKAGDKVDYAKVSSYINQSDIEYNGYLFAGKLYGYSDSTEMFTDIIRTKTDRYDYALDDSLQAIF